MVSTVAYLRQELIEHPELLRVAIVVHLEYLVHEEWLRRVGQDWTFLSDLDVRKRYVPPSRRDASTARY